MTSPLNDEFAPFAEFSLTRVRFIAHLRVHPNAERVTWTTSIIAAQLARTARAPQTVTPNSEAQLITACRILQSITPDSIAHEPLHPIEVMQ